MDSKIFTNTQTIILGITLSFPIFFTTNFQLYNEPFYSGSLALPFSLFFVFFWCILKAKKCSLSDYKKMLPPIYITLFIVILHAVYSIGFGDYRLFALFMVPFVFGFFLGHAFYENSSPVQHMVFIRAVGITVTFVSLLHFVASASEYGLLDAFQKRGVNTVFDLFAIYQKYIYYATFLSFGFVFVLYGFKGIYRIMCSSIIILDIALVGSREAFLLVLFFMSIYIIRTSKNLLQLSKRVTFFLGAGILLSLVLVALKTITGERVMFLVKMSDLFRLEDFTAGRLNSIQYVFSFFDIDAFFVFLGNGFRTNIEEIGTPHNQYLEWFLRGGITFLALNVFFLGLSIYKSYKIRSTLMQSVFMILVGTSLICNNINTPFRAPYTSIFLWFLIGVSFSAQKKGGDTEHHLYNTE